MAINKILTFYEEMIGQLEFQNISSVRTKIMINLSEGPKNVKDLEKSMEISHYNLLNNIIELKKEGLIICDKNNYYLSIFGEKTVLELINITKTFTVLKNNHELWLNHEIDAIPPELLVKIGDLSNSKLIEAESDDIAKVHNTHTQVILNSKKIRGVSPILYPNYIKTFKEVLEKNSDVELILTKPVLKKIIELLNPEDLEYIKRFISQGNLKLWEIKENVKVAFTVTDKFMTLGLFSINGAHDSTKNLVGNDNNAIEWCNKLFEYYKKRAKKVNLEYF